MSDEPIRRFVVMVQIENATPIRLRSQGGKDEVFDTKDAADERAAGYAVVIRHAYRVNCTCWSQEIQR